MGESRKKLHSRKRFVTERSVAIFILLVASGMMLSAGCFWRTAPQPRLQSLPDRTQQSHGNALAILNASARTEARSAFMALPLSFESGKSPGQFLARAGGYDVLVKPAELLVGFPIRSGSQRNHANSRRSQAFSLRLWRANQAAKGTGLDPLPGATNYLIGNDPTRWRTGVANFAKVRYEEIYPGIDVVYYGHGGQVEYDFHVAPEADAHLIRFSFDPGVNPRIDADGDLVVQTSRGEVRQHKPLVYQEANGARRFISASYRLFGKGQAGFEIGAYNHAQPLVIDPTLVYSTYLGGAGDDVGSSIAIDQNNNIYVAGTSGSTNFPTMTPAYPANAGLSDFFVVKINAGGNSLAYSTYIGGSGLDRASGIALDSTGHAYVVGRVDSGSANFPTTAGVAPTYRGGDFDAVVFKLNAQGNTLAYSTFLGGEENDSAESIAVDLSGNAYVTGGSRSHGFPTSPNAYQSSNSGDTDAYLVKLNSTGSAYLYSTLLGGGGTDRGSGVAIDPAGIAYLAGSTTSIDFPTQNAFQNSFGGGFDAFVAKLDTNASGSASLLFCSYLGGVADEKAYGIAIDNSATNVYLVGQTSSADFPALNPAQPAYGGNFDAFIAKVTTAGAKVYATYLGGANDDRGTGIAVNSAGEPYVTGFTSSTNFPTVNALQATSGGSIDAFVAKLNSTGSAFLYATYLGGSGVENSTSTVTSTNPIALDSSSNAYLTGYTASANFPTSSALQTANDGGQDAFIAKISDAAPASLQFSSNSVMANEGDGVVKVSVTRTGNTANAIDVDYATSNGSASSRTDYTLTTGTLHFAAGDVLKKFLVPLVDDVYVEGNETVNLIIRNPQGGGAFLGGAASAVLTIADNDSSSANFNPLDDVSFFVRQHYLDFLNREPDPDGLAYWANEITKCGSDSACVNDRRIGVSASFFVSDEFQESGGFVYRLYRATLGRDPTYVEFSADRSKLIGGLDLEANKGVLVHEFLSRPELADKYPDGPGFIAPLAATARTASGAALPNLTSDLQATYDNCGKSAKLCKELTVASLVDYPEFAAAVYNRSFVVMEYFGYLRRDPEPGGYAFWLDVLNNREPNNYRGMVCSFVTSAEYQQRFSPVVTRTNAECSSVH
ncbi:MAG: hypothetical protein QOD75_2395 [Blastocatellia bacterium]|jgi:hypothetical protein|nr:hypothetical protein [Blastocatellia bacterium]